MLITKKIKKEILTVMEDYWGSYFKGDLQTWASYLPDDYRNIGTTNAEIWNTKKEIIDYTKNIIDQMVGMAEMRNKKMQIIPYAQYIMVHELGDVYVKAEKDWIFYAPFRISTLLEKTTAGWKILHQHGSYPDSKTEEGEAFAFDELRAENKKLKDAIRARTIDLERKNRELEVEAALERVRARTMAMQKSEELGEVATVLFSELNSLVDDLWTCGFVFCEKNREEDEWWLSLANGLIQPFFLPNVGDYTHRTLYEGWEKGEAYRTVTLENGMLQEHYDWLMNIPIARQIFNDMEASGIPRPNWQRLHAAYFKTGYLVVITEIPCKEEEVFKRFAQVFDLTYTRFLDLQKAEAQAREAQIEAALEKVRSRSLAMHKSDELNEVVSVLFEKLKDLQIPFTAVGIVTVIEGSKDLNAFVCGQNEAGLVITNYQLPYFDNPILNDLFNALEKQLDFYVGHYSKEEKDAFYNYVIEHTAEFRHLPEDIKRMIFESPTYTISMVAVKNAVFNINDFEGKVLAEDEVDIIKRFARVFDQAYTRFLDLQRAEAQAREAEIQLALERVRAKTMAMKTQSDLLGIIELFGEQLRAVNVRFDHVTFIEGPITKKRDWDLWSYVPEAKNTTDKILIPYIETPYFTKTAKAVEAYERTGNPIQVKSFTKKEKDEFLDHYWKYAPASLDEIVAYVYTTPGSIIVDAFLKEVTVSLVRWDLEPCTKEELAIFERFAKEFRQTYIRFLDIKKAEAQTRESEIQLALERVRARTMAMQSSEELADAAFVLFEQLRALGGNLWGTGFGLCQEHIEKDEFWFANENGVFPPVTIPNTTDPTHKQMYQGWRKKNDFLTIKKSGAALKSHYDYMLSLPEVRPFFQKILDEGLSFPEKQQWNAAYFSKGYLLIITLEPYPEPEIFKRFAKVFEQTYTRFLDLQKAEAQAREAQIEAALERIRGHVTSMQESSDLFDIVVSMRKEFITLGHEADYFWHMRWGTENYGLSMTSDDGSRLGMVINVPKFVHEQIPTLYEWEQGNNPIFVLALNADQAWDYIDKMNTYGSFELIDPHAPTEEDIHHIGGLTFIIARTTHGEIGYSLAGEVHDPPKESLDTLVRFAAVFDLAYKRFEDLKEAEKRNQETLIELALERVRSRSLAMRTTDELQEVVRVVAEELKNTGVILDTWGAVICTYFQESRDVLHWTAAEDPANPSIAFLLPYFEDELYDEAWASKNRGDSYFAKVFSYDVKNAFFKHAFEHSDYRLLPDDYKKTILESENHGLAWAWSENSAIMIPSIQGDLPSDEEKEILIRFAKVFEQAYIRFLDLQVKEEQGIKLMEEKQRLEKTLHDLRITQAQLIQQEKLASLGQLTAGIAHEIQNPLNFVNNFSEVSIELVDEMNEELAAGSLQSAVEIANDIKQNMEKINHHGQRAASIVKSMLQHSRSSSGKMTPTDLNALIREYVNLSYHGMRAGKEPINVSIELDLEENMGQVPLIAEDFSRVIVNICNNAFDAMRSVETQHAASLLVRTKKHNDSIVIEIEDNGTGIPDEIKDKILQPFFTTKKGTEGTGLGLSITHDIVKAHGGELKVETKEGEGTRFVIQLPLKS